MERRRWQAEADAARLDKALVAAFPDLSRARLKALIDEGRVTLRGEPARASQRLRRGDEVLLEVPDLVAADPEPEDLGVPILHEDDDVIVVVKPAGMVVHPSAGHERGTLVNAMLFSAKSLSGIGGVARPGIVHRLDGGTSGVMVVAKNDAAHRALCGQFAVHSVERRYLAVVHRVPHLDRGVIRSRLARDPDDRLRIASVDADDDPNAGREAVTHWEVRARGDRIALMECRLETGRTHQVRVHLSEMGHPILGDRAYGRRDCVPTAALREAAEALAHPLLHAYVLAFDHPNGERLRFVTPPPDDFRTFCALAALPLPAMA